MFRYACLLVTINLPLNAPTAQSGCREFIVFHKGYFIIKCIVTMTCFDNTYIIYFASYSYALQIHGNSNCS